MSSFRTALKRLFRKSGEQTIPAARSRDRASRRVRLGLEPLEDRLTPAQILTVTSALDPVALTPGTLRYEVAQANHDAALGISDTITFNTTSMGSNKITLQQGQLTLTPGTGTTTINGGGLLTLDGSHASRLFLVDSGASATLTGLTIQNGQSADDGGAIENFGTLTVSSSKLVSNSAQYGGGIFNDGSLTVNNYTSVFGNSAQYGGGLYTQGNTTISTSTFQKNSATVDGGAIGETAALKVTSSNFYLNSAAKYGGAIFNESTGSLVVMGSLIGTTNMGNSAQYGGGIFNYSTLGNVNNGTYGMTVYADTISANTAQYGGGIYNVGTAKVDSSLISGNTATNHSGGLANTDWLTIRNSTIKNNGTAADGGGIWNESGTLYVNNGTNTMLGGLLPGYYRGSGTTIYENTANGPLLVYNGTQRVMQMMRTSNGVVTLFSGGGVYLSPDGTNIGGGGSTSLIATGVRSIAVDGYGYLFGLFTDTTIKEYTGSGSTWTTVTSTGFTDLVNDSTGNVFALGYGNGTVWEHVLGAGASWNIVSSTGFTDLISDATGNVFALGYGNGTVWEHVQGAGWSWNPVTSTGFTDLVGDATGNVFALGYGNGTVWEHVLGAGWSWNTVTSSGYRSLVSDATGNVFALDYYNSTVYEHVLGAGANWSQVTSTGFSDLVSDASGNVFVLDGSATWEHVLGTGEDWIFILPGA